MFRALQLIFDVIFRWMKDVDVHRVDEAGPAFLDVVGFGEGAEEIEHLDLEVLYLGLLVERALRVVRFGTHAYTRAALIVQITEAVGALLTAAASIGKIALAGFSQKAFGHYGPAHGLIAGLHLQTGKDTQQDEKKQRRLHLRLQLWCGELFSLGFSLRANSKCP